MEKLKFLETVTVNEFKAQKGVNKIEVKQNPHTGKCFFVYGCEIGAVSDKFLNGEVTNPVISQVCSPDTGDTSNSMMVVNVDLKEVSPLGLASFFLYRLYINY